MQKGLLCLAALLFLLCSFGAALDRQPAADYHVRREALAKKAGGVIVLVAPLEPMGAVYAFRQDDNFYYLSGITVPGAALLIAPAVRRAGGSSGTRIHGNSLSPASQLAAREIHRAATRRRRSPGNKTHRIRSRRRNGQVAGEVTKLLAVGRPVVYTELATNGETSPSAEALAFLKHSTAMVFFQDVKKMITDQRTVKDAGEIALIRKAVDASAAAHMAAMKAVKPNLKEYEISALMQYEWDRRGCERPSYAPIVGSGHNSTVLHYSENTNTMKAGDVVVIDAAAEYSMYAADITRTLPVNGHFTARQKEIYEIVRGAQEAAMAAFQSGKSVLVGDGDNSLNKVARDYIKEHGKDLHGQPLDQYFIHGLGHYIGLNVHDPGDYKIPLGPWMAFTIEPGIYIPEENIGVRIEDDFLVDANGKLIKLSAAVPSKPEDVEKAMAGK